VFPSWLQLRQLRRERARLLGEVFKDREADLGLGRLVWQLQCCLAASNAFPVVANEQHATVGCHVYMPGPCSAASDKFYVQPLMFVVHEHACSVSCAVQPLISSMSWQGAGRGGWLGLLSQPLKLRIRCGSAEEGRDPALHDYLQSKGLLNYSALIEPLASVRAIREFLERRLAACVGRAPGKPAVLPPFEREERAARRERERLQVRMCFVVV
jgi:hypothetical protein